MGIDTAHYHGWHGRLRSPWFGSLALVRLALVQVFRRKLYWLVLLIGLGQFLQFSVVIYSVNQMLLPPQAQEKLLENFGFSAAGDEQKETGYTLFMERQSLVVMILLAFSGSLLVGADFRQKSLAFYLSRRIDRRHYIIGKLLAVAALVSLLTAVPALLLFLEYGMFTGSFDYWRSNGQAIGAICIYGAVLGSVLSVLLVTISAYLEKLVPIAITWSTLFILLDLLSSGLVEATDEPRWRLFDLWHDMHEVGRLGFDTLKPEEREIAWWSLGVLSGLCAVCLLALVRRVRAVDVVQ
jgi:ABC-2 type transport system permease protein